LEDNYVNVNGVRLHLVQAGPPDGPLAVLLHGFPEYWRGLSKQGQALAQAGFRVLLPDQRGYNLSDKPKDVNAYQIDILAQDVVELIRSVGRERAFVIGHDWGAAMAWTTAILHPERVEKLAILNVPHPDVMQRNLLSSFAQMKKSWYIFFFQTPALPEIMLSRDNFANLRRMMKGSGRHLNGSFTFSNADLDDYAQAWGQPGALTAMIHWYRAIFRRSLRAGVNPNRIPLRRVHPPALMLWGERDIALGKELAQPSLDLCDQGRIVFYPNATHWVQHDETQAVNRELLAFLTSA
jgi:pimeloyl-ACP methyl ester carboxylesterase